MPVTRRQAQQSAGKSTSTAEDATAAPSNKSNRGRWKRRSVNLPPKNGQPKPKVKVTDKEPYNMLSCVGTAEFNLVLPIVNDSQFKRKPLEIKKHVAKLNEIYCSKATNKPQREYQTLISTCVWRCMCPMMQMEKNEFTEAGMKFLKASVITVGNKYTSNSEKENPVPMLYHSLQIIFQRHTDSNTNLKVRIMEVVRHILEHSQDSKIMDEFTDQLLEKVIMLRSRDKVTSVRVATLYCLTGYKDNVAARQALHFALTYDQSPEVRKVAVSLLPKFPSTKTSTYISKAFDNSEMVRAETFAQISKLNLNRIADKDEKHMLIQCGLSKSSGRTRDVLKHTVLPGWLNQCDNNLAELFNKLELSYRPKTARQIIDTLYPEGSTKEYQEIDWGFLSEKRLVDIKGLTVEKSQLWLLLCHKFKNNPFCANLLLPEPSDVLDYLKNLFTCLRNERARFADGEGSFIQDSIVCFSITLKLCDILNFEEFIRGEMIEFLRKVLLDPVSEDALLINPAVDLVGKLIEKDALIDYLQSIIKEFFDCSFFNGSCDEEEHEVSEDARTPTPECDKSDEMEVEHQNTIVEPSREEPCCTPVQNENNSLERIEERVLVTEEQSLQVPKSDSDTTVTELGSISKVIPPKESAGNVESNSSSTSEPSIDITDHFPGRISPILHPEGKEDSPGISSKNRFPYLATSTPIVTRVTPTRSIAISDRLTQLKEEMAGAIMARHRLVDKRDAASQNDQYLVCHEIQKQIEACIIKQKELQVQIEDLRELEGSGFSSVTVEGSVLRGHKSSFRNDLVSSPVASVGMVNVSAAQISPPTSENGTEQSFVLPGHSTLKALMILARFLGITKKITPFIRSLYSTHIIPCLEDDDGRVRAYTITLYCKFGLLDKRQAKLALRMSLQALQHDILDAQVAGFNSVVDLIIEYSLTFFQSKEGVADEVILPEPFCNPAASIEEMEHGVVALLNKLGDKEPRYTDDDLKCTGIGKLFVAKRITNIKILSDFLSIWIATKEAVSAKDTIATFIQLFGIVDLHNSAMVLDAFLMYVNRISESEVMDENDERCGNDPGDKIAKLAEFVAINTSPDALARFDDGYTIHENHIVNTLEHIKYSLKSDDTNEVLYLVRTLRFFTVSKASGAQEIRKLISEILASNLNKHPHGTQIGKSLGSLTRQLAKKFALELNALEDDGEVTEDEEGYPRPPKLFTEVDINQSVVAGGRDDEDDAEPDDLECELSSGSSAPQSPSD